MALNEEHVVRDSLFKPMLEILRFCPLAQIRSVVGRGTPAGTVQFMLEHPEVLPAGSDQEPEFKSHLPASQVSRGGSLALPAREPRPGRPAEGGGVQ